MTRRAYGDGAMRGVAAGMRWWRAASRGGGARCGDDAMRALVAPPALATRPGDGRMATPVVSPRRHDVAREHHVTTRGRGDACVAHRGRHHTRAVRIFPNGDSCLPWERGLPGRIEKSRQGCRRWQGGLSSQTHCLSHDNVFAALDAHNPHRRRHRVASAARRRRTHGRRMRRPSRRLRRHDAFVQLVPRYQGAPDGTHDASVQRVPRRRHGPSVPRATMATHPERPYDPLAQRVLPCSHVRDRLVGPVPR